MSDDELLERLGAALAPTPRRDVPAPSMLQDLHRAVDHARTARSGETTRHRRWFGVGVAAATTAVCVALLTVGAVRRSDRDVTIEVAASEVAASIESPALRAAREQVERLDRAVREGDVGEVATLVVGLRTTLAGLAPGERAALEPDVTDLLERADQLLPRPGDDVTGAKPSESTEVVSPTSTVAVTTPPTTSPPATTIAPTTAPGAAAQPGSAADDDDDSSSPGDGSDDGADSDDDSSGPGGGDSDDGDDDDHSGPGGGGDPGDD